MPRTKQARKFGGRPVERKPELGKRTHLTIALALPLKRRIEREAAKQGRSISNEAALRLEQSFEIETLLASFGQVVVNVMLKAMEAKDRNEPLNIEDELRKVAQLIGAKGRDKK